MTTQVTSFIEGRILSGGSDKKVYHWEMNGDPVMGVPVSLSHVLALSYNTNHPSYQMLAVSGDSSYIDIFTNFGYKAFSISVIS
jgi:THO complex subunit 6